MSPFPFISAAFFSAAAVLLYTSTSWYVSRQRRLRITTSLRGPSRINHIWGWSATIAATEHLGELYEKWVKEFGSIVGVPSLGWDTTILVTDPKAAAHFYANDPTVYGHGKLGEMFLGTLVGRKSLLTAKDENHKRLRKALTPAFSSAAIRRLSAVFFDSAHKAKAHWESILDSGSGDAIIEVQEWMNYISMDSIGIAGFGHDFGSLDGKRSPVVDMLSSFGKEAPSAFDAIIFLLSVPFPSIFSRIPSRWNQRLWRFRKTMSETAQQLIASTKEETKVLGEHTVTDKSIIGLLIKAESTSGSFRMTTEEVTAQMNVLLFAGYETTSISLTWALIELARNVSKQDELRQELAHFSSDLTYEQITSSTAVPILDAVAMETFRLHPPLPETLRVAHRDDVVPLSKPYTTSNGTVVDRITIAKGSTVTVPIIMMNRSKNLWGPDAKEFNPSRWLDIDNETRHLPAKEVQGYRHLLTFSDGPRTCLGKNFAIVEFKAALSVLVRNFTFEFPDGPETKLESQVSVFKRPKVAGELGPRVPLRIRRV
ncbi:cytochrome P450 [Flagelloscypha sp. PMI_526]|nr:cytochrome P450 [Flagelloscypha sp. PMI_526]